MYILHNVNNDAFSKYLVMVGPYCNTESIEYGNKRYLFYGDNIFTKASSNVCSLLPQASCNQT